MTDNILKPGYYWAKYKNEIEIVYVDINHDDENDEPGPDFNFAYRMGEFDTTPNLEEVTIIAPVLSAEEAKRLQDMENRVVEAIQGNENIAVKCGLCHKTTDLWQTLEIKNNETGSVIYEVKTCMDCVERVRVYKRITHVEKAFSKFKRGKDDDRDKADDKDV